MVNPMPPMFDVNYSLVNGGVRCPENTSAGFRKPVFVCRMVLSVDMKSACQKVPGFILNLALCHFSILTVTAADNLASQLRAVFEDPEYSRSLWGVKVQSVSNGETLFELNAEKLLMPASNMKLLTAIAALEFLGPDYRYSTKVKASGRIEKGTLKGDLIVVGSGDPTLGARLSSPDPLKLEDGDPLAVFLDWVQRLKSLGIRRIQGDLIGNDQVFGGPDLGKGWAWDDLAHGYSAPLSGLQYNENVVVLQINSKRDSSGVPTVRMVPDYPSLQINNLLTFVPECREWEYDLDRIIGKNKIVLRGSVPSNKSTLWSTVSVERPAEFFLSILKQVMSDQGIKVDGVARVLSSERELEDTRTLFSHESPSLRFIVRILLKVSQNLYAETLVRTMDRRPFAKTFEKGREVLELTMQYAGIPEDAYVIADGSGLSRYNLLTPEAIISLLHFSFSQPYREDFLKALPVAGVDGTISQRLKGTVVPGKIRAKTGSLESVRSLSGYVVTPDGETLAFSMIVNNYDERRKDAEAVQDLALQYMSRFTR